jgi:hypothetical protein
MPERSMLDLAQAVREQIVKETPPRRGETPRLFAIKGLGRLALWGGATAATLLLAVISSRSEVGMQRLALALHGPAQPSAPQFDAQAETRKLVEAVRGLAADNDQIKTRVASVESDMDGITGSVSKEIEAANASRREADGPTVAATAALTATMVKPTIAQPVLLAAPAIVDAATVDSPQAQYGVDIGSGLTIPALRARWEVLRSAHPDLFAGLQPIVSVKEIPHANRIELRLVVGPLALPAEAVQLCSALVPFGLFCQPAMFDGQKLALR